MHDMRRNKPQEDVDLLITTAKPVEKCAVENFYLKKSAKYESGCECKLIIL